MGYAANARVTPIRRQQVDDERQRQRFMEIVAPQLDDALGLARWLTGNRADAEDIVQEAAIRALRALHSFEGVNARAWVLAIVRNTALTWMTKNRTNLVILTDDMAPAGREERDGGADPEAAVIAKADAAMVRKGIAALPLKLREMIVLREIEHLSYQEIAQVTGVPVGTVMSRLSRAREKLAVVLCDDGAAAAGAGARLRIVEGKP